MHIILKYNELTCSFLGQRVMKKIASFQKKFDYFDDVVDVVDDENDDVVVVVGVVLIE
jgi:transcription elongation factor Elf1